MHLALTYINNLSFNCYINKKCKQFSMIDTELRLFQLLEVVKRWHLTLGGRVLEPSFVFMYFALTFIISFFVFCFTVYHYLLCLLLYRSSLSSLSSALPSIISFFVFCFTVNPTMIKAVFLSLTILCNIHRFV